MTSIDTWSPWIAIIVAGGPIMLGAVNIAYCLYLSRRHLDAMMEAIEAPNAKTAPKGAVFVWACSNAFASRLAPTKGQC